MSEQGKFRRLQGGRIDRAAPLNFNFDGRRYTGYAGDTLASALLANGVRLCARSFKYHRPRGLIAAGVEEPNAIVQLEGEDDEPNVPATCVPLREGLRARSVNRWPGLRIDLGSVNDWLHGLFPAGFYYKTFIWPSGGWSLYGRIIRHVAGLGCAPKRYRAEDRYERRFHHCDVLVVGAGPSGLAAALSAGRSGARVVVVDEQSEPGGQLLSRGGDFGRTALEWVRDTLDALRKLPNVLHLQNASAFGYYDHNMVYVAERSPSAARLRERLWRIRARRVILATGALERPLVFANNDRPGVMLAGAAVQFAHRYGVLAGRSAVMVANNDTAYDSALELAAAGTSIVALIDTRTESQRHGAAREAGIEVLVGHTIRAVHGRSAVRGVTATPSGGGPSRYLACDALFMSGGWSPTLHLHGQAGAKPQFSSKLAAFVPGNSAQGEACIGAAAGTAGLAACVRQGVATAQESARALGLNPAEVNPPDSAPWDYVIEAAWELPGSEGSSRAFVDFGHDVTAADVRLAVHENYESVELVKRYTTAGMAIDQGKLSNVNTIGIVAGLKGRPLDAIGTTTFRPVYSPVSFGLWAGHDRGELIVPARRTPMTAWFERSGAEFNEAAEQFRRPFRIPRANESAHDAVQREVRAARTMAAIYDGTPLGKFELHGPDVVTLLNRIYTNRWDSLETGMGRFGWMLHEDGRLFDDGVTFRLGPQHYWMTTGSGAASAVHAHLERLLQWEWPELNVYVTPVTEQWANMCVCGPQAREILRRAGARFDLSPAVFPFMAIRTGHIGDFEVRAARVSYSGELSFELNVRARDGLALWEHLLRAGAPLGITPIGSESILLLRLEKGFIAGWAEGEGNITPDDAGLGWNVDHNKGDFIGRRSLALNRGAGARLQIVGLLATDPRFVPSDGAPLLDPAIQDEGDRVLGHVTAAAFSPHLERSIALAQLQNGRTRIGSEVTIFCDDRAHRALVTKPVFYDPSGARMRS